MLVDQLSENWRLDRLAAVDRSILRLAIHELRSGTAPPKVVIDEALELAKNFFVRRCSRVPERNLRRCVQKSRNEASRLESADESCDFAEHAPCGIRAGCLE